MFLTPGSIRSRKFRLPASITLDHGHELRPFCVAITAQEP